MEGLQGALMAAKKQWGAGVTLGKAAKGSPGFPFPVTATRCIARPAHARQWDVEALTVCLKVVRLRDGGEGDDAAGCVAVDVPEGENWALPGVCREAIARAVASQWALTLGARGDASEWLVLETLAWVEFKFADLMGLVPECVEAYVGEDPDTGDEPEEVPADGPRRGRGGG